MDSAQERQGYPERSAFLAARRARHPSEDRMDDFTNWTILGQPADDPDAEANFQETHPLPGSPGKIVAPPPAAEPTYEEYIKKRTEFLMHKNMSTRRGYGGMLFSMNGGGDGGCAYQVAGAHTGMIGSHHSGVNYATWPPEREDGYTEANLEFNSAKPTMIPKRMMDTSKAKAQLEFEAKTPLKDGIRKTIAWYRENRRG